MVVFRKKVPRFAWAIIPALLVLSLVLALFPSSNAADSVVDPPSTQVEEAAPHQTTNIGEQYNFGYDYEKKVFTESERTRRFVIPHRQ